MKDLPIQQMIVQNLLYTPRHPEIIPTFMGTVSAGSRRNEVPEYRIDFNRKVKVIAADWEKLRDAGLWEYE